MRCASPIYYVGGGGISVSRSLKKLEGESLCMYLAVGSTVAYLQQLVSEEGIEQMTVSVEGWTRDNLSVTYTVTNLQYRFGVTGPHVKKKNGNRC